MPRIVPNIQPKARNGRVVLDYRVNGQRYRETIGPDNSANWKLANQVVAKRVMEIREGRFFELREIPRIRFADFAIEYLAVHAAKKKARPRRGG